MFIDIRFSQSLPTGPNVQYDRTFFALLACLVFSDKKVRAVSINLQQKKGTLSCHENLLLECMVSAQATLVPQMPRPAVIPSHSP